MEKPCSVGCRVVRGPDWPADCCDDGGVGSLGTVVSVTAPSAGEEYMTAQVIWDTGVQDKYRCGASGNSWLRMFDSAPGGGYHEGVDCSECDEHGIAGLRWQCLSCDKMNLCSSCYMADCHDTRHEFMVFIEPNQPGTRVPCRYGSTKVVASGIFPGATVKHGADWEPTKQDSGQFDEGVVSQLIEGAVGQARSMAVVGWDDGNKLLYAVGYNGKVELKCLEPGSGGLYYDQHLPLFGQTPLEGDGLLDKVAPVAVGNLVQLLPMDTGALKTLQDKVDGWSDELTEMTYEVGEVCAVGEDSASVQYPGRQKLLQLHMAALAKVQRFYEGEKVSVIRVEDVRRAMMATLHESQQELGRHDGVIGIVCSQHDDHSVLVKFNAHQLRMHPGCLVKGSVSLTLTKMGSIVDQTETRNNLNIASAIDLVPSNVSNDMDPKWNIQPLSVSQAQHPTLSETTTSGRITEKVLDNAGFEQKPPPSLCDNTHVADAESLGWLIEDAIRTENDNTLEVLCLQHKDRLNDVYGENKFTYMHIAAEHGRPSAIRILHDHGCHLDQQKINGFTPVHDAAWTKRNENLQILLRLGASFDKQTEISLRPLHICGERGNATGLSMLVEHAIQNGIPLAEQLQWRTKMGRVPLMAAVNHGSSSCVEQLVVYGPDLNVTDDNGHTALHLAVYFHNQVERSSAELPTFNVDGDPDDAAPLIYEIQQQFHFSSKWSNRLAAIACFLAKEGANVHAVNSNGKTPIALCSSDHLQMALIEHYSLQGYSNYHASSKLCYQDLQSTPRQSQSAAATAYNITTPASSQFKVSETEDSYIANITKYQDKETLKKDGDAINDDPASSETPQPTSAQDMLSALNVLELTDRFNTKANLAPPELRPAAVVGDEDCASSVEEQSAATDETATLPCQAVSEPSSSSSAANQATKVSTEVVALPTEAIATPKSATASSTTQPRRKPLRYVKIAANFDRPYRRPPQE